MRKLLATLPLILAAGCATTAGTNRLAERDPLEGFNRAIWAGNQGIDKVIVKPVTTVYRAVAPRPARKGVSNAFSNLYEPFSFMNNLLQLKPKRAIRNFGRFAVNSTIGIVGLFDHASRIGIKPAPEDLGQTFASWGVNGGPYLVLPLLGPSTLRDGLGTTIGFLADPFRACLRFCGASDLATWSITGAEIINIRSDLTEAGADSFLKSTLDPYASARSAYLQRRFVQIRDQESDIAASEAAAAADAEANPIDAGFESLSPTEESASADSAAPAEAPAASPEKQ